MRVDEIRARLEKATPGPWKVTESRGDCGNTDIDCGKDYCDEECKKCEHFKFFEGAQIDAILTLSLDEWDGMNDADAIFIANAPSDIEYLLSENARLTAERDAARRDCAVVEKNNMDADFQLSVVNEQLRISKNDIRLALELIEEESQRHRGKTENTGFHSGVIYALGYAVGALPKISGIEATQATESDSKPQTSKDKPERIDKL